MQSNAVALVHVCTVAAVASQQYYDEYRSNPYASVSFPVSSDETPHPYSNHSVAPETKLNYYYPTDTKEARRSNLEPPPPTSGRRNFPADEAQMTVPQLIQKNEYPAEEYTVPTKDGYVLTMHRIPRGRVPCVSISTRPVIFLMHGIFASSADFIINGPGMSLGYLLADAGYDVWMGNARGNRYSRNHRNLIPANAAFWDFSFHEIGYYDLPAMIDFVRQTVDDPSNLFYIGHSQGTTVFYIFLSTRPEYNRLIRAGFSFSPISFMTHMTSPLLRFFATFSNMIGLFFDVVGIGEFLPTSQLMSQLGQLICKGMDFTQFICTTPLFVLAGYNPSNLNKTRFPVYMGHLPAGSSTRQVIHYGQLYLSGKFRQFDLGVFENLATFNSLYPPDYNLHKITVPNHLYATPMDWLGHPKDVDRLVQELPNSIRHPINDPNFAHFDFMYGINAKEMIYDPVLEELKKYANGTL